MHFVTYSWQWDQICQLLLKKFFYISYGLVYDQLTLNLVTYYWQWNKMGQLFVNKFFDISYRLGDIEYYRV